MRKNLYLCTRFGCRGQLRVIAMFMAKTNEIAKIELTQTERFDYLRLLAQVKKRVQLAQQRAIYSANDEMLRMYWDVGHILSDAQLENANTQPAVAQLPKDMRSSLPSIEDIARDLSDTTEDTE